MRISIILGIWSGDIHYLRHALSGILTQKHQDYELIITAKMPQRPMSELDIAPMHKLLWFRDDPTGGTRQMNAGLKASTGDFVVWLSGDNIVYPNWLASHVENYANNPKAISLVNTHHFQLENGYIGILPSGLYHGGLDRLNMGLPMEIARDIDAYGPWSEREMHSDWLTFEKAAEKYPVQWDRTQPVCAIHI